MKQEISAGIIIYRRTNDGPRFLLLYSGGAYWSFPKGKLEGESSFQAALREVGEETGLMKKDLRFKEWFRVQDRFMYTRDKQKVSKLVIYYLAEAVTYDVRIKMADEKHEGERHYGYGWFLYRDALRMLRHQNLRENLKRAYDLIIRKKSISHHAENPAR